VFEDPGGDLWVPLAQPYGVFVREMLETQRYPEVKLVPGKDIVRPYDVAAWSLPLMMGVTVERGRIPGGLSPYPVNHGGDELRARGTILLAPGTESDRVINQTLHAGGRVALLPDARDIDGKKWPAGTAAVTGWGGHPSAGLDWTVVNMAPPGALPLSAPRVALYKPWAASMDEGWTRFLLEQYGFEPKSLDNAAVKTGGLRAHFDAIVLPDVPKEVIATGKPKRDEGTMTYFVELPPEYKGGLDTQGAKALRDFVEDGGTLVALAGSCDYVIEQFNIPVVNALARATPDEFGCPGSLLRARVNPGHPVTWGLPDEMALFVDKPIAFQTAPPASELRRWVLATYPDDPRTVLESGWIRGEDKLRRRAAAVALTFGKGKLVLLGFRAQNRAQTNATFPFLFNALYWSTIKD
jgi:hypothetical protein